MDGTSPKQIPEDIFNVTGDKIALNPCIQYLQTAAFMWRGDDVLNHGIVWPLKTKWFNPSQHCPAVTPLHPHKAVNSFFSSLDVILGRLLWSFLFCFIFLFFLGGGGVCTFWVYESNHFDGVLVCTLAKLILLIVAVWVQSFWWCPCLHTAKLLLLDVLSVTDLLLWILVPPPPPSHL